MSSSFAAGSGSTFAAAAAGTEWLVDCFGCEPERLQDAALLTALSEQLIARLELQVIGRPLVHRFGGPGGVTGLYLLSESHLAWHTYPESELATFNLYCCRSRMDIDWAALLTLPLGARRIEVVTLQRGAGSGR